MKKLLIVGFALLCVVPSLSAQNKAEPSTPSLEDTVQWLNENTNNTFALNGTILTVNYPADDNAGEASSGDHIDIKISTIDPDSLVYRRNHNREDRVYFSCLNGNACIHFVAPATDKTEAEDYSINTFDIPVLSGDSAPHVIHALQHLFRLTKQQHANVDF